MAGKTKKLVKRAFFEVRAPLISTKIQLYGASKEELVGRVVSLDLTRVLRGKSLILSLKVVKQEDNLEGDPTKIELAGSYIRRMIRKGSDYIEDSFIIECKDAKAVIKPYMITRNKISRAVRSEIRNEVKKHIEAYAKARTIKEVMSDIISNKIQKELSLKSKKIYPLALCEIRILEILTEAELKRIAERKEEKASRKAEEKIHSASEEKKQDKKE
jgi:ribosomal protein S3AE